MLQLQDKWRKGTVWPLVKRKAWFKRIKSLHSPAVDFSETFKISVINHNFSLVLVNESHVTDGWEDFVCSKILHTFLFIFFFYISTTLNVGFIWVNQPCWQFPEFRATATVSPASLTVNQFGMVQHHKPFIWIPEPWTLSLYIYYIHMYNIYFLTYVQVSICIL